MKEVKDKQPPYPNLLDCHCQKEECAWTGCFFENAIGRINRKKLGFNKAYEIEFDLIEMAVNCGCKKVNELKLHQTKLG